MHIVINNQVGFTISRPDDARSTLYCTDPAKIVGAPVLHVNGDDPEAVVFCAQLAFDFRQAFERDVVIDLVCYRRHGHNEADEPAATQPLMYQNIRARKTTRELYADALAADGVLDAAGAKAAGGRLPRQARPAARSTTDLARSAEDPVRGGLDALPQGQAGRRGQDRVWRASRSTASPARSTRCPNRCTLHARVAKIYEDRRKMLAGELPMDWGFAENLAYATLLAEGYQPAPGRPGFRPRHLLPPPRGAARPGHRRRRTCRCASWSKTPEHAMIIDSLLAEEAVMAFEYGYSTAEPMHAEHLGSASSATSPTARRW